MYEEEVIFMNLINVLASCNANGSTIEIPDAIVNLTKTIIFVIQVVVPILLILWGMLDFAKGVIGQDEDKIKAGQKKFIQRLIAAAIVFLIVTVVQIVITTVGNISGDTGVWQCASQIIK